MVWCPRSHFFDFVSRMRQLVWPNLPVCTRCANQTIANLRHVHSPIDFLLHAVSSSAQKLDSPQMEALER